MFDVKGVAHSDKSHLTAVPSSNSLEYWLFKAHILNVFTLLSVSLYIFENRHK